MLKKPTPTNPRIETAIEELENSIVGGDPESDRYMKQVSTLETLYKLRNGHKPTKTELKDWIPVIGSLSGILVIVLFEAYGHTLTSKSLGFVGKLKG